MELLIKPIEVGSLGVWTQSGLEPEPWAMTVTIEPDAIPNLREVLDQNSSVHPLDATAQWHTLTDEDPGVSPLAFLRVEFPEFGLMFNIGFRVDEYKRSLAVAARTGRVLLVEPALTIASQRESTWTAVTERMSIGLPAFGVEPLLRARRLVTHLVS